MITLSSGFASCHFLKILIFVAFLVPYIAIRMVVRQQSSDAGNGSKQ